MVLVGTTRLIMVGVDKLTPESTAPADGTAVAQAVATPSAPATPAPAAAAIQPANTYEDALNRAGQCQQNQDWQGACRALDEAIRLAPADLAADAARMSDLYTNLGACRIMAGDHAGATAVLQKAVELNPSNADALANRGLAEYHGGRTAEASQDFRKALEIDPANATAQSGLRAISGNQ